MMIALLLSLLLAQAPAPPKAAPAPQQPKTSPKAAPAQPRTQAPRQAATGAVAGMAITVTDGKGTPFSNVLVDVTGTTAKSGATNASGQLSLPGLRAGTYRLRFSGDGVVAFEREVTLKAGEIAKLPITLTAAEPPKPAAAPPPPPPSPAPERPVVGPTGSAQLGSLTTLAERERNTKEPRREILLACSGNTRSMLVVLNEEQAQRVYDAAEVTYYVVSGQGGARVGSLMSAISPGSFIAIPRGTPFTIARQGNRPLTMLWTVSGEPCEQAR